MINPQRLAIIARAVILAAAIAVPAEGVRQVAYRDPGGILTACMGDTHDIDPAKVYRLDECYARLDEQMRAAVIMVETCRPGLPRSVLAAFGDAVYNMGPDVACNTDKSTAARYLAAGDLVNACNELPRWNHARIAGVLVPLPGLTKRRETERRVCLTELT